MNRVLSSIILILSLLAAPALAQSEAEVEAARLLHIEGDFDTALKVLIPAANAGNPVAQNVLGVSYEDGMGVPQDINKAIYWYEAAAAQGLGRAMHSLGVLYRYGTHGIDARPDHARTLFERAIEAGYLGSYSNLGAMLENGEGGETDLKRSLQLYQAGAARNDRHCTNNLGHFYRQGIELEQDLSEARRLYGKAALLGLSDGYNNLGVMHEEGMAGPSYPEMAVMLYRQAMAQDNARAAINIAGMIHEGRLPGLGDEEAVAYCLWAVRHGSAEDPGCVALAETLSEEAQARAQALSERL
ncbi:sel1 repeat family protein [Roseovarius faecimaris]|uniref:Sel1 repeat family protein n=1 Tax=Roseovarius faecimaris TaxID=2494550 RepID=A0A6I6IRE2_9RHOB|nr:tetratricopeptide repeat protein [Roseovarius faecimaris]QGX98451.1 sel1 repeat family protein [Roseovarius faecimaris]